MKLNRKLGLTLVAVAAVGAGAAMAATTPAADPASSNAAAPSGRHWHRGHHGSMLVGTMLRAAHQLNLTSEQEQTIRGILGAARSQHQQPGSAAVDFAALANPGDPNYAAALQNAKEAAAARLQRESELQAQIYNVLTPQQKAQLPQVLATMKAKFEQRRAEWQQQHGANAPGAGDRGAEDSN